VTIASVARQYDLGFIPIQDEHYDFAVPAARLDRPAVQRFRALLEDAEVRAELVARGFGLVS
jgi:putative molybdopterin biosynthesis protein